MPSDVTSAITDTLTSAGGSVPSDVTSAVTDTLSSATDSAPAVTDTLSGVADSVVSGAAADAGSVVSDSLSGVVDTSSAVTDSLGGVVDAGAGAGSLEGIVSPFTTSVDASAAPLGEGVAGLLAPLTTSVDAGGGALANQLGGAGEPVVGPFALNVEPEPFPARDESASGGHAVQEPGSAGSHTADPAPAASATHPLVDSAATTAAPAAVGDPGDVIPPVLPVIEPGSGAAVLADPVAASSGATAASQPAGGPLGDLGSFEAPPGGAPVLAAPSEASPPADADSVLDIVAQAGADGRVLVSAAVLTLAGAAILAPRAGGTGADARMAFTQVRLLPCLVKESASRHIVALTENLAAVTGTPLAAGAAAGTGAAGSAPIDEAASGVATERSSSRLPSVFTGLQEGFGRVTDGAGDVAGELSDSRLDRADRDAARLRLPRRS